MPISEGKKDILNFMKESKFPFLDNLIKRNFNLNPNISEVDFA